MGQAPQNTIPPIATGDKGGGHMDASKSPAENYKGDEGKWVPRNHQPQTTMPRLQLVILRHPFALVPFVIFGWGF